MPQLRDAPGCPSTGAAGDTSTVDRVSEISHEDLGKNFEDILRRVEAGEEFTITVSGQPVAKLDAARKRTWVDGSVLEELAKLPVDTESLARDLKEFDIALRDPWAER
jgi:prevent-host-death family protein